MWISHRRLRRGDRRRDSRASLRALSIAAKTGFSACRKPVPIQLLPITAHSEIVEHRLPMSSLSLFLASELGAVVDADIRLPLEVNELGAEPDVELADAPDLQPDEVGHSAGRHLDGGRVEGLTEDVVEFGRTSNTQGESSFTTTP